MIVEPELRIPDFAKAGADIISVHAEQSSTIHLHRTIGQVCKPYTWLGFSPSLACTTGSPALQSLAPTPIMRGTGRSERTAAILMPLQRMEPFPPLQIKDLGCKAGVVLNPATPVANIEYILDSAPPTRLHASASPRKALPPPVSQLRDSELPRSGDRLRTQRFLGVSIASMVFRRLLPPMPIADKASLSARRLTRSRRPHPRHVREPGLRWPEVHRDPGEPSRRRSQ